MANNQKVCGVQCPKCRDIIVSCYRHDWHTCSCKQTWVDGGLEYTRIGYATGKMPYPITIELIGLSSFDLALPKHTQCISRIKTKYIVYDILYRYTYNRKGKFYRYPKGEKGAK